MKISQDYASPYVTKTCLIVKKLFDSDFSSIKIIDSKNKILLKSATIIQYTIKGRFMNR